MSILMVAEASQIYAHTNSIGYTSNGGGSATFWYGNWHPHTTFNEGSIELVGQGGLTYDETQAFNLLSQTLPVGLVAGTNYFSSDGTSLVPYNGGSYTWQGATFTGLTAGTYLFTYIPIAHPTANWQPEDSIILSSTITLTPEFLAGGSGVDLNPNAFGLRSAFNLQSATINAGLNYDCKMFDTHGVCLSGGGRYTNVSSPSASTTGALLISAYRASENLRGGVYLDKNLITDNTKGIRLSNNNPMGGVFAVWNKDATDGVGLEGRVAAGYSNKNIGITRNTGLNTDAGTGSAALISKGVFATVTYGKKIRKSNWIASPYIGSRYAKITRQAYTEDGGTTSPLTYTSLSQETTVALVGVRLNGQVTHRINVMGNIGLEQDLNHNVDDYVATGGNSVIFNSNINHTRPFAAAGANFAIDYRQSVVMKVSYGQEAFESSASATGLVTYQVGF